MFLCRFCEDRTICLDRFSAMGTIFRIFTFSYLILYEHYALALNGNGVTVVNEDTIDKEYDYNTYRKNLFQPTSYLNAGYGIMYEHVGTVHQNVHTHYLIVRIRIPTYKDIPEPAINGTKPCILKSPYLTLAMWQDRAMKQCRFFNALANQVSKQTKYWYNRAFGMLHSDVPAMLPNQEIQFLSESDLPIEEESNLQQPRQKKRDATEFMTRSEKHRLITYAAKYNISLPCEFDTFFTRISIPKHYIKPFTKSPLREKWFINALIRGLSVVSKGGNIFGRIVSGIKKIGGFIFRGVNGLFHHHKNLAISRAVEVFKKYSSKLKIGELFKFQQYRDLHISKLSLYDKLHKALHRFGPYMNHKTFLRYLHNKDNGTWYYDQIQDVEAYWQ